MLESVLQPMRDLLTRYARVASTVARAIATLEGELEGAPPSRGERSAEDPATNATLELPSSDFETLLNFQERLSEIPGVIKVTIAGAKEGRSKFLVELEQEESGLVVCANCGKTLIEGRPPASHGLCEDCRESFGRPTPLR